MREMTSDCEELDRERLGGKVGKGAGGGRSFPERVG